MFKFNIDNQKDREVGIIYSTNDYDKFSFKNSNRKIQRKKVDNLKKSLEKIGQIMPILVNDNFQIQEGQHRFTAIRELGLDTTYFFKRQNVDETVLIVEANVNSTNWFNKDFIYQQKVLESEKYEKLSKNFNVNCWEEKLPYHVFEMCIGFKVQYRVLMILNYKTTALIHEDELKQGDLKINDMNSFKTDVLFLKHLNDFKDKQLKKIFRNRYFQLALIKFMASEKFDREKFLSKIDMHSHILRKQGDTQSYVDMILKLYNFASKRKYLFTLRDLKEV
jgi:hypothetical protein|tara:strand:- start:288 stop:1121 length:834 start_codon:yes stop_codon:yes gene_type:complete